MDNKYYSTHKGKEIDDAIDDFLELQKSSTPMTQAQYDALTSRKAALYFIVDELGRLQKIYFKSTLIAKRGETPNNTSFPYTFPIVFS